MRTNDSAYIELLIIMSVALDNIARDERHTVYMSHVDVPQFVQALRSPFCSISGTINHEETEDGD